MAGGRLFCFAMQRTGGSAGNSCPSAIAVPIRLPQSPSTEGTSARRLEDAGDDDDHQRPRTFPASQPLPPHQERSEEHTSELQSLMRTSHAVFCLKKKKTPPTSPPKHNNRCTPISNTI